MKENFCITKRITYANSFVVLKHNTATCFRSIKFAYMKIPGHYELSERVIS